MMNNDPADTGDQEADTAEMRPLTLGIGIELAFMTLLTLTRVASLLGAPLLLCVWLWSGNTDWLMASLAALLGYAASTALFAVIAGRRNR